MASTSLFLTTLLIALLYGASAVTGVDEPYGNVVADQFMGLNPRSGSRFLKETIKKGDRCDAAKENICGSVAARNGTELLSCCKGHCRNVLGDRNNCGQCGNKCGFGQLCCNGICTVVAYDANNCGKCAHVCGSGVRCEYGICGYA